MKLFIMALGLVFIFEGIIPFISPNFFKKIYAEINNLSENTLRTIGVSSILTGLIILYLTKL